MISHARCQYKGYHMPDLQCPNHFLSSRTTDLQHIIQTLY